MRYECITHDVGQVHRKLTPIEINRTDFSFGKIIVFKLTLNFSVDSIFDLFEESASTDLLPKGPCHIFTRLAMSKAVFANLLIR